MCQKEMLKSLILGIGKSGYQKKRNQERNSHHLNYDLFCSIVDSKPQAA